MTGDFVTKRPHKKSRGGCTTCKSRKVKCNEAHPICQYCEKRNLSCVYQSKPPSSIASSTVSSDSQSRPASRDSSPGTDLSCQETPVSWELIAAPTPVVQTSSGSLSIKDLRLVHLWSTSTANNIGIGPNARDTLMNAVPQLAFENDFVLNCILGISSLQLQRQCPGSELARRDTDIYRGKALSGFRQALSLMKPGSSLYESALITSILLVVLYSKNDGFEEGELLIVNWLILYRGLSTIISIGEVEEVKSLSIWPIFQRDFTPLQNEPVVPRILVEILQGIHPRDPDFPMLEGWCKVLDTLGLLYGGLQQDGLSPELYIRIVAWPSYTTQDFTTGAQQRRPRVLVILTYYLSFLKLLQGCLWWTDGIADREIQAIAKLLGPAWHPFMEVPLRVVEMTDCEEIAKVLLS